MKKIVIISMAALFLAAPCYGNAFKKAAWVVVPYLKNQALIKAAQEGDVVGVKKAIKAKAKVDAKDKQGLTAMIYASRNGHNEVVKLLIAAGANVNLEMVFHRFLGCDGPRWHYTALGEAVAYGHVTVVETLIKAGADVNGCCGWCQATPLMLASSNGHNAVVVMLIKAGADINAKTYTGETALSFAKAEAVVKTLLDAGAVEKVA